jgi:hypothetical protein
MIEGGPAALSGAINIGDIVLSVGGVSIQGLSHEALAQLVLGVSLEQPARRPHALTCTLVAAHASQRTHSNSPTTRNAGGQHARRPRDPQALAQRAARAHIRAALPRGAHAERAAVQHSASAAAVQREAHDHR